MQPIGIEYRHKPFFEVDSSQWRPENIEENYFIMILEDHIEEDVKSTVGYKLGKKIAKF